MLESTNRLEELGSCLAEASELYPEDPKLNLMLARSDRRKGDIDSALSRLERLKGNCTDQALLSRVCFEMAYMYDSAGRIEDAYNNFRDGNDVDRVTYQKLGISSDPSRKIIAAMNSLDLQAIRYLSDCNSPPVDNTSIAFIIGFPRSGTTLLHQIFAAHPLVDVLDEKPLLAPIKNKIDSMSAGYPQALLSLDEELLLNLKNEYMESMATHIYRSQSEIVIDKLPLNLIDLPLISLLFPQAKIILALRHPLDCCLSCFMQMFNPNQSMSNFLSLEDATSYYSDVMGLLEGYQKYLPLQYMTIRYEEIVHNLESETRRACSFLGVDWNPSMLEYYKNARKQALINTPSRHQVTQPLYTDSIEKWRRYEQYLAPYKPGLSELSKNFGYRL